MSVVCSSTGHSTTSYGTPSPSELLQPVTQLSTRQSSLQSADENALLVPRTSLKFGEWCVHGRMNRSNNMTNKNFYVHVISTFVNVKWTPIVLSEGSRFHPNRFTFGRDITERVNTAKSRPIKWIQYSAEV